MFVRLPDWATRHASCSDGRLGWATFGARLRLLSASSSALSLAATVAVPAELVERSTTLQVTYDTVYDDASNSLDIVYCSNGVNGLEPRTPSSRPDG